ncbi:hypothetical protein GBS0709_30530 [Edwardsiella tarda]|nr:hypothetical protein GBS0709_30530 [Edwardsiella tarda]
MTIGPIEHRRDGETLRRKFTRALTLTGYGCWFNLLCLSHYSLSSTIMQSLIAYRRLTVPDSARGSRGRRF